MHFGRLFSNKPIQDNHQALDNPFAAHLPPKLYDYFKERNILDSETHLFKSAIEAHLKFTFTMSFQPGNNENPYPYILIKIQEINEKTHSQKEQSIYFRNRIFLLETMLDPRGKTLAFGHHEILKKNALDAQVNERYSQALQASISIKLGTAIESKPQIKIKLL